MVFPGDAVMRGASDFGVMAGRGGGVDRECLARKGLVCCWPSVVRALSCALVGESDAVVWQRFSCGTRRGPVRPCGSALDVFLTPAPRAAPLEAVFHKDQPPLEAAFRKVSSPSRRRFPHEGEPPL